MSTHLVKQQTNGHALVTPGPDPFEAYANAVSPRTNIGTLLRFSKGDYVAGEEGKEITEGLTFTANLDELMTGWVKWSDGKPVEQIMVRVAEGRSLPKRAELGDTDPTTWETDSSGKPRDPWQPASYLPLMDEEGRLFTFATSSRGGLGAIGNLSRLYAWHRRKHSEVYPIVALEVGSYQHQKREYGRIKFPKFKPIGWEPKVEVQRSVDRCGVYTNSGTACVSRRNAGGRDERQHPLLIAQDRGRA
jgi:hypothetical protein